MKEYLVPFEAEEVCWNACLARVEAESAEDAYFKVKSIIEEGENPFTEFNCDWDGINTVTTDVVETTKYSIDDDDIAIGVKAYIAPKIFNCWKDYYSYRVKDLLEANDLQGDWIDDIIEVSFLENKEDREIHFLGNSLKVNFIYLCGKSSVNITQINDSISKEEVQVLSQKLNSMLREDSGFIKFLYTEVERIYTMQFPKISNNDVNINTIRELERLLVQAKEALRINQLEEMKNKNKKQ